MKKIKKKYRIHLIILLIIAIFIFIYIKPNKVDFYYMSKSNIYNNKQKINKNYVYDKVEVSKDNNKLLYYEDNYLFMYDKKKKKSTKIKKNIVDYKFINNNFIYLDTDNNLYIYKEKEKLLEKSITKINSITDESVIYTKDKKIYNYNINNNKKASVSDSCVLDISEDKSNLLLLNKDFKIYNLKKDKVIDKQNNISNYYCINESCTKYYYLKDSKLKNNTNNKLNEEITNLEYYDNDTIIYTKYGKKYSLYYKKKNNKEIKVLSDKNEIYNIKLIKNKIYFESENNLYEVQTNGKGYKKIVKNITDIIDIYNNKILLIKENNLYLNNKLLVKNIDTNSIKIIDDKVYVITDVEHNNSLYIVNKTKAKKISKNVNNYWKVDKDIYYLADYDTSKNSGNLYKYNRKKIVLKDISRIIINENY